MTATLRRIALFAAALSLVACSAIYRNHGYVPAEDELAPLQVGISDKADVTEAIGRPTALGVLSEGGWYYVQSRFRHYGTAAPEEIDRQVLAVSFTDAGTLSNIERYGLQDGRVVRLSRRVTTPNAQGVSFLGQLFGNIGNLDAADFVE